MRNFLIVLILIISFSKMGKTNEHIIWPSTLDENSLFYRGQRTGLTSFKKLLQIVSQPEDNSIVTSRLFRTLLKLFPNKKWSELMAMGDQQVARTAVDPDDRVYRALC